MEDSTNLTDRVERFPEPWRPAPGEKVVGVVSGIAMRDSEYSDEPYPMVTIRLDEIECRTKTEFTKEPVAL